MLFNFAFMMVLKVIF